MEKKIITISREFGSGGRSIGKLVSEKLGIPFYDKELVKKVAVETGFHEDYVEQYGENAPSSSWLATVFASRTNESGISGMSADDFLWSIQNDVIIQLAEKGACVIVGRCSDYILRNRSDCFNAFIHADTDFRIERIVRLYGESESTPEKRLTEKDKKRRMYYHHYTDRDWGMSQNYDISLNSSTIGIEKCADIIVDIIQKSK